MDRTFHSVLVKRRHSLFGARAIVLAYHAVTSENVGAADSVRVDSLEHQLRYLARREFLGLTFADAERRIREDALPRRAVVVTFDDASASIMGAKPILDSLGWPGTVFAVTSFVGVAAPLRWYGLSPERELDTDLARSLNWEELRALVADGWEVGSHTVSHRLLSNLSDSDLLFELAASRAAIAERLGACHTLAYPYGQPDQRVARAAREVGYSAACTLTRAEVAGGAFLRNRVALYNSDRGIRLAVKVSRLGMASRRSPIARSARRVRRRRDWLPAPIPPRS